jgi:hypothetical protein
MEKIRIARSKSWLRRTLPVVVATLSLSGVKAAQALDIHVSHSGTDHTAAIQAALNNSAYSRVILDYYSSGWTSGPLFMNTPNQELWIAGSGSNPGKLTAKRGYPNFSNTSDSLIKVMDPGCTINGYANGVDKTNGIATLKMWKADYVSANGYTPGEHRMIVRTEFDDTTIKGAILYASGGDGIYINGGSGSIVKDVVADSANRNGISVIKADNLRILDSTFKSTSGATTGAGAGPWAGIDFEPNLVTDSLTDIQVHNCIFSGNVGDNILIDIGNLVGTGVGSTCDIWFYNCTVDNNDANGIQIKNLRPGGPTLGRIYFQDTTISNSESAGIKIREWAPDQTRITFNRFDMSHCADNSTMTPIYFEDGSGGTTSIGDILFQNGCYVDDYYNGHPSIVRGQATGATAWKDITGQIFYRCNYTPAITSANAIQFVGSSTDTFNNVGVTMTPY